MNKISHLLHPQRSLMKSAADKPPEVPDPKDFNFAGPNPLERLSYDVRQGIEDRIAYVKGIGGLLRNFPETLRKIKNNDGSYSGPRENVSALHQELIKARDEALAQAAADPKYGIFSDPSLKGYDFLTKDVNQKYEDYRNKLESYGQWFNAKDFRAAGNAGGIDPSLVSSKNMLFEDPTGNFDINTEGIMPGYSDVGYTVESAVPYAENKSKLVPEMTSVTPKPAGMDLMTPVGDLSYVGDIPPSPAALLMSRVKNKLNAIRNNPNTLPIAAGLGTALGIGGIAALVHHVRSRKEQEQKQRAEEEQMLRQTQMIANADSY